MVKVSRDKMYTQEVVKSLSSLMELEMSLEDSLSISKLKDAIIHRNNCMNSVFSSQIVARGGTFRNKGQVVHNFPNDPAKITYETELQLFFVEEEEFDFELMEVYIQQAQQEDINILIGIVDVQTTLVEVI